MPYCKNCGHALPEGTGFCPECGTPVKAPSAPASGAAPELEKSPRGGGPKIALIAVIAVVVVALIAAAVIFLPRLLHPDSEPDSSNYSDRSDDPDKSGQPDPSQSRPESAAAQFTALQREMLGDLLAPLSQVTGTAPVRLSSDLTFSLEVDNDEIQTFLNGSYLTLRLDVEGGSMLLDGELGLMGTPILTGYLTYDDGTVGFCLPEADGNYYTLPLGNLLSAMMDVPVGTIDLDALSGAVPSFTGRDISRMAENYMDVLLTVAAEDNVTRAEHSSFELPRLGGSYTGTVYTCIPTAKELEDMYLAMADQMEKDRELRALFASIDEFESQLAQAVQELRDTAAQEAQDAADAHFTWTLCTADDGKSLLIQIKDDETCMALEWYDTGRDAGVILYSEDGYEQSTLFENRYTQTPDRIEGTLTINGAGEPISADYDVSVKDGWAEGSCSITADGETVTLEFNANLEDEAPLIPFGTYKLFAADTSILMYVTPDENGNVDYNITIPMEPTEDNGQISMAILDILVSPTGTAQAPGVRPTDISRYSSQQLKDLFEQLGDDLSSSLTIAVIGAMYGNGGFGGLYG